MNSYLLHFYSANIGNKIRSQPKITKVTAPHTPSIPGQAPISTANPNSNIATAAASDRKDNTKTKANNQRPKTPKSKAPKPKVSRKLALCDNCEDYRHATNNCFLKNPEKLAEYLKLHPQEREHWESRAAGCRRFLERQAHPKRELVWCETCEDDRHPTENCFLTNPDKLAKHLEKYPHERKHWETRLAGYQDFLKRKERREANAIRAAKQQATWKERQAHVKQEPVWCETCENDRHPTKHCFLTNPAKLSKFLKTHPDQREHWEARVNNYQGFIERQARREVNAIRAAEQQAAWEKRQAAREERRRVREQERQANPPKCYTCGSAQHLKRVCSKDRSNPSNRYVTIGHSY